MTAGFVALWNNNQREYVATPADEWGTTAAIQGAFANGRERGVRTYGLYYCRWSSPWQYLTFWVSPTTDAIFDTIADLERAGDFKYADSLHRVGVFVDDETYRTPGAWEIVPEPVEGSPPPLGVVLIERRSAPPSAERARGGQSVRREMPAVAADLGIRMYGAFDGRFGGDWDRFTFWTAPDLAAVERALGWLERALGPDLPEMQCITGRLDRYFRFGNHLQTELTWLNKEETAR
ncbi:MAG TPA: hypothetical protein VFU81_03765 [Thermomicrobiales bacterium]|nr:hypothetical protein [Thermomicrobiales bacterium]